jgi:quinol monooxygenase YgiN
MPPMDRLTPDGSCRVFELRQYTLQPGRRDELIELFDTHLVEPQEDAGMRVVGQFRDLDRPDRFVWVRGYKDMAARLAGLTAFYVDGEVWARHRAAANATMRDSDDVLLLRPVLLDERFSGAGVRRALAGAASIGDYGVYLVAIHHMNSRAEDAERVWRAGTRPVLEGAGAQIVAVLRTEHAPNAFPRLPVREDVEALVVVARFNSPGDMRASAGRLATSPAAAQAQRRLAAYQTAPSEYLVLEPTARSALR